MKRVLMMAAALAIAGCTAPALPVAGNASAPVPGGVVAQAGQVILTGERAFAAAELAYITAADGVGRLADRGLIRGERAVQVRAWNARARQLLVTGKGAADAAAKARAAAELFGLADLLNAVGVK